jgi:glycosyltransferase involved in cell wall biosynthesis
VTPLVSVVIPTRDRCRLVAKAVESALAQTYPSIEVIVVDDGSTEDVAGALAPFAARGLRVIRHDRNLGAPAARNSGIAAARGEYVAFLDSDDEWAPEKVERQVALMLAGRGDVSLVYCGIRKVDESGRVLGYKVPTKRGMIFDDLLRENCVGSTSVALVARTALNEVGGFDVSLKSRQDLDLWLRIARLHAVDFAPEPLVTYRVHANRISSNAAARAQGYEAVLQKYFAEISERPSVLAGYYFDIGRFRLMNGERSHAAALFKKSLMASFSPKALAAYLASRIGPAFLFSKKHDSSEGNTCKH